MPGNKICEAYLGGQGSRLQAFSSCGGRRLVTHSVSSAISLVCLFRQVTTASWTPAHNNTRSQPAICTQWDSWGQSRASGAALGLMCMRNRSLTARTHSSRVTAMAAEREEAVSCMALMCLLSTSKCFPEWILTMISCYFTGPKCCSSS